MTTGIVNFRKLHNCVIPKLNKFEYTGKTAVESNIFSEFEENFKIKADCKKIKQELQVNKDCEAIEEELQVNEDCKEIKEELQVSKDWEKEGQHAVSFIENEEIDYESASNDLLKIYEIHNRIRHGIMLENSHNMNIIPGEELLFVFNVKIPFTHMIGSWQTTSFKKSHTIVMLGSEPLNKLCDKILCGELNQGLYNEMSNTPFEKPCLKMGDIFKSRMLYIGNTFYIDKSHSQNLDYSFLIKEWGEKNGVKFGATLSMHNQTCLDIVARIRYPYVFQHLGCCEHIIQINDVRLITPYDSLQRTTYPMYTFVSRIHRPRMCLYCNIESIAWLVFDEERHAISPVGVCESCFLSYQYTKEKKVSDFKAIHNVPYYEDTELFSHILCRRNRYTKLENLFDNIKENFEVSNIYDK